MTDKECKTVLFERMKHYSNLANNFCDRLETINEYRRYTDYACAIGELINEFGWMDEYMESEA